MKKKVHLPSMMNFDESDLPEIKDWQEGQEYTVTARVKMVSKKKNDPELVAKGDEDADKVHGKFEIIELKTDEEQEKHEASETESEEQKEHKRQILSKALKYVK